MATSSLALSRYVLIFLAATLGGMALLLVLFLILEMIGIEPGSGASLGGNIGVAIGAAGMAARRFGKDHGRPPTSGEAHRLAAYSLFWSFSMSLAVSLAFLWLAAGSEGLAEQWNVVERIYRSLGAPIPAAIAVAILTVFYVVVWWTYRTSPRR